jgi:hypothetical protein
MNLRRVALGGMLGAAAYAVAASRREPEVTLHECDWVILEEGVDRRCFESPGHFIYHLRELASIQVPIAEVYLFRAITAAFRERIMLVTTFANECSW